MYAKNFTIDSSCPIRHTHVMGELSLYLCRIQFEFETVSEFELEFQILMNNSPQKYFNLTSNSRKLGKHLWKRFLRSDIHMYIK